MTLGVVVPGPQLNLVVIGLFVVQFIVAVVEVTVDEIEIAPGSNVSTFQPYDAPAAST